MPGAVQVLEASRLAPGDLRQAMIGPGMKVYSGYARVNEPNGDRMPVRGALKLINQVFDEYLSQLEGDINADTRWCLEWYKQHGFDPAPIDEATKLARGTNTDVKALRQAGVVQSARGKVQLLPVDEIRENYDPTSDDRVSEWKICLHIAKCLKDRGTDAAARLMAVANGVVDMESVQNLANTLYTVADMEKWAQTAALFNALVTSWPDLDEESKRLPTVSIVDVQEHLGSK
jgi:putative DNA methylase